MWQIVGIAVSPLKHVVFRLLALVHRTTRPRMAIICGSELLIIRNWGDRRWSLPGGGMHKGETPEQGAIRECHEEIGVVISVSELRYITTLRCRWYDAPVYVWRTETKPQLKLQKLEITGHRWSAKNSLPPLEENLRDLITKLDF